MIIIHLQLCLQEAQRAAKAANQQVSVQKQKDTPASQEQTKKQPATKTQPTAPQSTSKSDVSTSGKLLSSNTYSSTSIVRNTTILKHQIAIICSSQLRANPIYARLRNSVTFVW